MQKNVGYELGKEIIFDKNMNYDYQPQYYGTENFSEAQRIQQGYQPYFNNASTESMDLIIKKWWSSVLYLISLILLRIYIYLFFELIFRHFICYNVSANFLIDLISYIEIDLKLGMSVQLVHS